MITATSRVHHDDAQNCPPKSWARESGLLHNGAGPSWTGGVDPQDFSTRFSDWQTRARVLTDRLRPVLERPVDINQPGWEEALASAPHPVDEVGVRREVEAFFGEVVACFESLDEPQRQQLLDLMAENHGLMYSAAVSADRDTREGLRQEVILFILNDQGRDPRDAMMNLDALSEHARKLGVDPGQLFRELAPLASDQDRYGWGSTREFLTGTDVE